LTFDGPCSGEQFREVLSQSSFDNVQAGFQANLPLGEKVISPDQYVPRSIILLRKAVEETARRFNGRNNSVESSKSFASLSSELQAARNKLVCQLPVRLYERIISVVPANQLQYLVPNDVADIDALSTLSDDERRLLTTKRKELRKLVSDTSAKVLRKIALIDEIMACRERVLNPAAHSGFYPQYFHEVQHALTLIRQLDGALD